MDELLNSCPPMDFAALEEEILGTILADDNYIFFRHGCPETQWLFDDGSDGWELYCTACRQTFFRPKSRKFKPSQLTACPECGAKVAAKRWLENRRRLDTRILYYKFQRGEGRRIWLHAYAVTHDFSGAPGDEALSFFEMARYLFEDGGAHKWTHAIQYFGQTLPSGWQKRKQITKTNWRKSCNAWDGCYPAYIGPISYETIRSSCLEYSQLDRAIDEGFHIPEYCAFYLRYPMIEFFWKFGLEGLLWEALMQGRRGTLQKVARLKAKRPKNLLRGLTVSEVRKIADSKWNLPQIETYQRLKKEGIVHNTPDCWRWSNAVNRNGAAVERAKNHGVSGGALRAYIERQARRSGCPADSLLLDYGDYLHQLEQLQIEGGDPLPSDLRLSHERLSARLRTVQKKADCQSKNYLFRHRRRQYAWMRWQHDGMQIRPVDSVNELLCEGENQHNCVANYAGRHARGETIICVLRRQGRLKRSWHTVELHPETLEVRQCRGRYNAEAAPEAAAFIEAWTARLQNIKFEKAGSAG